MGNGKTHEFHRDGLEDGDRLGRHPVMERLDWVTPMRRECKGA